MDGRECANRWVGHDGLPGKEADAMLEDVLSLVVNIEGADRDAAETG